MSTTKTKTKSKCKKDYQGVAERYKNGARLTDLAKEYGISRVGMYYRLKEEGITDFRDDRKKINVADAIDMYNQGMTMANIAKHFNCDISAISVTFKRHNVATRNKAILPDLENLDNILPDVKKDQHDAFKEFQKDFSKQLLDDRCTSNNMFDDDDDSEIAILLRSL